MRLIHPEVPGCVVETDNPQQYLTQGWVEAPPESVEANVDIDVTLDDDSSSSSASEPTNEIAAWAARREESPWP